MNAFVDRNISNEIITADNPVKHPAFQRFLVCLLLLLLVVSSALAVIYSSFKSRQLFSELEQKNKVAMQLEEEWGRLLLEQSTWASHARIEKLAKDKLQMVVPDPSTIVVLRK